MCDDLTEAENTDYFREELSRRALGRLGAGAVATSVLGGCGSSGDANAASAAKRDPARPVQGKDVAIGTPDGNADAYFVHPKKGRHPAVILWPDVAGLRPAYRTMADRLAGAGYAVLAVNSYYRSARAPVLGSFAEWRSEAGQARIGPMRASLTADAVTRDGKAFVAWLASQTQADPQRRMASIGYCMGGPFTFRTAAGSPEKVGAIASFHGGGLVTDKPDSPHLLLPAMKAAALIAIAQNDDARDPGAKDTLKRAASDAGRDAEIEVYPAQHGWCTIDSPVYDKAQAERAWDRMLATFRKAL